MNDKQSITVGVFFLFMTLAFSVAANPCDGKDPAKGAKAAQTGIYEPDTWENIVLERGATVYGGIPGQSEFYTNYATVISANGSKSALWESLQVKKHNTLGYRGKVQPYVLKEDACVAVGKALINTDYGAGGGTQYFTADYKSVLTPQGDIDLPKD